MALKQELQEKAGQLFARIKELRDKSNDPEHRWTDEEEGNWRDLNADYESVAAKIEKEEQWEKTQKLQERDAPLEEGRTEDRLSALERANLRSQGVPTGAPNYSERQRQEDLSYALHAWSDIKGEHTNSERHKLALKRTGIDLRSDTIELDLVRGNYNKLRKGLNFEFRVNQSTSATEGGEFVPEGFVNNLERALLAFGSVRQVAQVVRTPSGNDLPWPTVDDTSNSGTLVAESTDVGAPVDVTTGSVVFNAYKYTSELVKVSQELIEDSAFEWGNLLATLLGERIGRITETHFTTGTGTGQPNGAVTAAGGGVTFANAASVIGDDVIDLFHDLDPAYRAGGNLAYMMNDSTLAAVRKLQDGNGQYLWIAGLMAGIPDTLYGQRVVVNQEMASIATTNVTMLFADWSKYVIRDVRGLRLRRLVERYAEFDQVGFVAFSRHDGDAIQPAAIRTGTQA